MKRLLILAALLFATPAFAGVSCSVPFNLTNGTTADASQVMANYNAILACLANNAAASGVNGDITALTALTTPLPPSSGGTRTYLGTGVSGTASNAITVTTTSPAGFALSTGIKVEFVADGANSAATTINVSGTGVKNLYRITAAGVAPMVGGEIVTGQLVEAIYDGTEFQMTSQPALDHAPGESFDYAGAACPAGSLEETGATTVSQTAYPTLYGVVSTIWGSATGGDFTIPDLRGRATFGRDSSGSGRITSAGGNFDGTTVGHTGGQQNFTVAQTYLPNVNFTNSGITLSNNTVTSATANIGTSGSGSAPATAFLMTNANSSNNFQLVGSSGQPNLLITSNTTVSSQGSAASGGSGTPLPVLSNAAIVLKCIKG